MRRLLSPLAILTVIAISLLAPAPTYPWGDKGHEITGHIAQAHLTDHARAQIKAITGENFSLAREAVWPDHAGRKITDLDPLHFVNFPADAGTYERDRDCPDRNCVVEALAWFQRVLADPEAPRNVRRIALRYVVHLVGDIHQPLHAAHGADRGGNLIPVTYEGRRVNLHALWDSILLDAQEDSSTAIASRLAQGVSPDEQRDWQRGTPAQWALESLDLARTHAYRLGDKKDVTTQYAARTLELVHRRLAQSGVRLAWILNEVFK